MIPVSNNEAAGARRLTITIGQDQRGHVEAIARRRRTSAATVIRWAIDAYVARELGADLSSDPDAAQRP